MEFSKTSKKTPQLMENPPSDQSVAYTEEALKKCKETIASIKNTGRLLNNMKISDHEKTFMDPLKKAFNMC